MEKENLSIPKHRFDCVNLALKETKQKLVNLSKESDTLKLENKKLKRQLLIAKVEIELVKARVKNIKAALALIDESQLSIGNEGSVLHLEQQISTLKNEHKYLFNTDEIAYAIIPFQNMDIKSLKILTEHLKERIDKNDIH